MFKAGYNMIFTLIRKENYQCILFFYRLLGEYYKLKDQLKSISP